MHCAIFVGFAVSLLIAHSAASADLFTLRSSAFADNDILESKYAGNAGDNRNCTGSNIAPPFEWSNLPDGTKSLAFLIYDPEGRNGLGVSHQVAYGIPATKTHFNEGDLNHPAAGFVGGTSTPGATTYYGPCPSFGSGLHHYVFTVIATDIAPTQLEPGLTREQLFERLTGHAKGVAGTVARFGQ